MLVAAIASDYNWLLMVPQPDNVYNIAPPLALVGCKFTVSYSTQNTVKNGERRRIIINHRIESDGFGCEKKAQLSVFLFVSFVHNIPDNDDTID